MDSIWVVLVLDLRQQQARESHHAHRVPAEVVTLLDIVPVDVAERRDETCAEGCASRPVRWVGSRAVMVRRCRAP